MTRPESIALDRWLVPETCPEWSHVSLRGGKYRACLSDDRAAFTDAYTHLLETGTYTPSVSEVVDLNWFPVLVDLDLAFFYLPYTPDAVAGARCDSTSSSSSCPPGAVSGPVCDSASGEADRSRSRVSVSGCDRAPASASGVACEERVPKRVPKRVPEHAVTESFLREAVGAYRDAIASMCEPESAARTRSSEATVMQRAAPYASKTDDGVEWKDGVHVLFPDVRMSRSEQTVLHSRVLAAGRLQAALTALIATTENTENTERTGQTGQITWTRRDVSKGVLDASAYSKPNASWQMYGSSKPKVAAPYLATFIARGDAWEKVENPREWRHWVARTSVFGFKTDDEYELVADLTTEARAQADQIVDVAEPAVRAGAVVDGGAVTECRTDEEERTDIAKARAMLPLLAQTRCEAHDLWRNVGMALHHTSPKGQLQHKGRETTSLLADWIAWSSKSSRHSGSESAAACTKSWESFGRRTGAGSGAGSSSGSGRLCRLGSLIEWAREDAGRSVADGALAKLRSAGGDEVVAGATTAPVALHDLGAAQQILRSTAASGRVRRCGPMVWVRMDDGNWSCSAEAVQRTLMRLCQHSGLVRKDARGNVQQYTTMVGHARNVVTAMRNEIPNDPTFEEELAKNSCGKLFFADGVFHFSSQTFCETEDLAGDMTTVRVPYPFPRDDDRDPTLEAEVWDRVFRKIFGEGAGDAECFLQHVARGLAGMYEDKQWVLCQADRNSGKGVLEHLLKSAFGAGYVATVNSESLLMSSASSGIGGSDEAKRLSWLLKVCRARLSFAKEMPTGTNLVVNGALIKGKLASGGDPVLVRNNYSDEIEVVNEARFFLFVNETPDVQPADAMELVHVIPMPYRYVSSDVFQQLLAAHGPEQVEKKGFRVGDHGLKAWCSRRDVCNAAIRIILDAFQDRPVVPSAGVLAETGKMCGSGGGGRNELATLWSMFAATTDPKDVIHIKDVMERVRAFKLALGRDKVRQHLEKMGAKWSDNAVDAAGKRSRGFLKVRVVASFQPEGGEVDDGASSRRLDVATASVASSVTTVRTSDWVGGIGDALPPQ
jgi:hypothetical protein